MTENWMSNLPEAAQKVSIIYLAISGSHNSMTNEISRHSKISPDADNITRKINHIFPWIVRRWAKTQNLDAIEQLNLGIRYFDLRICLKDETTFYFAHGYYSSEVFHILQLINNWLNEHPKEFLILDFQHFYDLKYDHHQLLQNKIAKIFNKKIYSKKNGTILECTLENLWKNHKQIFIIYRYLNSLKSLYWPSDIWPTPWPNTCSTKALKHFLNKSLSCRSPNIGYVSQCIITPTPRFIIIRFPFTLRFCVRRVNRTMNEWIKNQHPGIFNSDDKPLANVFIADFIELNCGEFCKTVIELNNLFTKDSKISIKS